MLFTNEPMVNMGTPDVCGCIENGWKIYTADGMPFAQWEVMALVIDTVYEVLSW